MRITALLHASLRVDSRVWARSASSCRRRSGWLRTWSVRPSSRPRCSASRRAWTCRLRLRTAPLPTSSRRRRRACRGRAARAPGPARHASSSSSSRGSARRRPRMSSAARRHLRASGALLPATCLPHRRPHPQHQHQHQTQHNPQPQHQPQHREPQQRHQHQRPGSQRPLATKVLGLLPRAQSGLPAQGVRHRLRSRLATSGARSAKPCIRCRQKRTSTAPCQTMVMLAHRMSRRTTSRVRHCHSLQLVEFSSHSVDRSGSRRDIHVWLGKLT